MDKKKMDQLMAKRTAPPRRDVVAPVNLLTGQPVDKSTSQQIRKSTKKQSRERGIRYTTYLPAKTIKAIKQLAVEKEKNDYEVIQDIIALGLAQQSK